MPTGYTSEIEKGITFKEFASTCARAFGAMVGFREDPISSTLPDEVVPSDYHSKEIIRIRNELGNLNLISNDDAESKSRKEHEASLASSKSYVENKKALRKKYIEMLKHVKQWQPPAADHAGLKDFMIQQIEDSIKFDCSDYTPEVIPEMSGKEWLSKKQEALMKSLSYHTKEDIEERKIAADRSEWIRQLKESLKEEP